jgi:hypothetical protein
MVFVCEPHRCIQFANGVKRRSDPGRWSFAGRARRWPQISLLPQPFDQHALNKSGRRQLLGSWGALDGLFHVFGNAQGNRFGLVVTLSMSKRSALIKVVQRLF